MLGDGAVLCSKPHDHPTLLGNTEVKNSFYPSDCHFPDDIPQTSSGARVYADGFKIRLSGQLIREDHTNCHIANYPLS